MRSVSYINYSLTSYIQLLILCHSVKCLNVIRSSQDLRDLSTEYLDDIIAKNSW